MEAMKQEEIEDLIVECIRKCPEIFMRLNGFPKEYLDGFCHGLMHCLNLIKKAAEKDASSTPPTGVEPQVPEE